MKLQYHKGKNFGDAINPIVFNYYLKDLLNEDDSEIVLGIGSILGLFKKPSHCKKVYVFSSGYAKGAESTYGAPPKLDSDYDIICLRGKGTAQAIGVSDDLAIADGALLLPLVLPKQRKVNKKYAFSFMPHCGTLDVYEDWSTICQAMNIHLIDPRNSPEQIIDELMDTEVLLAEAMHGAIIADAYRIPWISIKTITTINEFKWADYCETVEVEFKPWHTDTLYSKSFLKGIFKNKLRYLSFLSGLLANLYFSYQLAIKLPKVKRQFKAACAEKPKLSEDAVLDLRQKDLLNKMQELKSKIVGNSFS